MSIKWFCLAVAALVIATIFVSGHFALARQTGNGSERVLSKITFIHFRKRPARPPWAGGNKGGGKKEEEGYYSYIAKGAKWKTVEDFLLNPYCDDSTAEEALVEYAVGEGMGEWETYGGEIFGGLTLADVGYEDGAYRGWNTISFGSYGDTNVIAVTTVWGFFTGPPSQREIVEAHVLMNDDFTWGDALDDLSLMDVQNIVTHELGHCTGMDDVYQLEAAEETMYGYSIEGDIEKRDLYKGDITGITKLYE